MDDVFCVNVEQPHIPKEMDNEIFHAPKLTSENTTFSYYDKADFTVKELYNTVRSLAPNIGTTFNMTIRKWVKDDTDEWGGEFDDVRNLSFKVYDAEIVNKGCGWIDEHYNGSDIITDWKNYFYLLSHCVEGDVLSVKKIQIPGKKILDIKDFLKGFQVYNKPEYNFFLN